MITRADATSIRIESCILGIVFLPQILFFFKYSESLALSLFITSILICIATPQRKKFATHDLLLLITIFLLIIIHSFFVQIFFTFFDFLKPLASLFLLLVIIFAGMNLGRIFLGVDQKLLNKSIQRCFQLLCVVGFLPLFNIVLFRNTSTEFEYMNPIFPFKEPSLYALIFLPFLFFEASKYQRWKKILPIILGLVIGILYQSMTLLAGCIFILLIFLNAIPKKIILIVLIFAGAVFHMLDISYYLERLPIGDEHNKNVSWLVFEQGWGLIYESIKSSNGLGIGFQQLGINAGYENVEASNTIYQLTGSRWNILDGGFNCAKIVSEFGFIGVLLILCYLWVAFKAIFAIKKMSNTVAESFAYSILLSYFIELFLRGQGYFSGSSILLIASLYIIWQSNVSINVNPLNKIDTPNI